MATFASPVSRDSFIYNGILYADVGNSNRHPRAPVDELQNLLRPELAGKSKNAKAAKAAPAAGAPKDPVGHWYTAQLMHYGLPPTKDKNTAKVRLLQALNNAEGRLAVPASVVKLEADLKKEWDAENRKLRKASKSTPADSAPKPTPKTTKAKRTLDGGDESKPAGKQPPKKQKTTPSQTQSVKTAPTTSPRKSIGTAKRSEALPTLPTRACIGARLTQTCSSSRGRGTAKAASNQTRSTQPVFNAVGGSEGAQNISVPSGGQTKKKQTARCSRGRGGGRGGAHASSSRTQSIQQDFDPNDFCDDPNDVTFTGLYEMTCPFVTDNFDVNPKDLVFFLCKGESRDK